MPHDFLEELNNEKERLTSATENTDVNQLLAENLQKTIDKAKESSESFEILQRVVSSFNISGKNLSDNIGLIIDVFNRLNSAVKNNAEATSSLKQTHNSNIFGGTVRGAENLIQKLEEIANGIESVDNPFSGVFDKAISDGKEYLSIVMSLSQELKKISHQNIKLSASIKSPTRRGDEIVANLNENNNSSEDHKKRRRYPKNFTRRRAFFDGNKDDDSVEYFFENFIKQNEDFRKISQLIENNALLKNSFFNSLLTKLNSRGSKGPDKIIRTVTEHLQKNLYNAVELMISNLKNNIQDIDWKKERLDDFLSKQSTLNSDDIIQKVIHSFAVSDFDIEKLAEFSKSKKLSGDSLSQKINETFGENSVSLFERLMIGEKDDEIKEAIAEKKRKKALENSIGEVKKEIKLEESDLGGIYNKLFDEIVGSLTENIVSEKENKEIQEISSGYDEIINRLKQRLLAYNENIDEKSKILEDLYESDDGYSKEYMRIVKDRKTSLENLNYRQEEREKIKTGEKSFEDSVFAFERKDAKPSSIEEALEIADEIIEKNKKRLDYWDKLIADIQKNELIYSDEVIDIRKELDKLVKNRNIVSKNIVGLENEKQQEIKKTKKEFHEDYVYEEAKTEGAQKGEKIKKQYDKLSPELKKEFIESLNKIISEIANTNNLSKKEALESTDFIESYSGKLLELLKSIEDTGAKTINEMQENLVKEGKGISFSNVRLETIKKAGLEFEVGNIIKSKGRITEKDIIKILKDFFKTDEGKTFVKENKINEDVILGKKRGKDDLTKYSLLLLNQTVELTNKFANLARQINEFGVGWANLNKELAGQTTSGSDLLAGQTTKDWGDKFNLTQKETAQLFPVIESFIRNSNVSLDTVNKIAENLKNSTGVLNPEDLKSALTAIQGMTQGQVSAMTGGVASMSDRYGAAFTLMENSSQLDAAIKAFSTGAFTGETPEGLSEGDKALLENNQNILKTVDSIRGVLSHTVSRWTPYIAGLGEMGAQIGGIAQMVAGSVNMGMELIQTMSALKGLGATPKILAGLVKHSKMFSKMPGILGVLGKGVTGLSAALPPLLIAIAAIAAVAGTIKLLHHFFVSKPNEERTRNVKQQKFFNPNERLIAQRENEFAEKKFARNVGSTIFSFSGLVPLLSVLANIRDEKNINSLKKDIGFSEQQKARFQNANEGKLQSLRSLKTYQTLNKQLESGQYTKYENAMSQYAGANLQAISQFGGSNAGFGSFSSQQAVFATESFKKSMQVFNNAIDNSLKGLNAFGKEAINGEHALAAQTTLIQTQIKLTKQFVETIENSIGRYSEIPSIMLNEIKNKISSFTFETNAIGGGTVAGGRQLADQMAKRQAKTIDDTMNQLAVDIKNAEEAKKAYKATQEQQLKVVNSALETNYSMEDLKKKDVQKRIAKEKSNVDAKIRAELEAKGISADSTHALQKYSDLVDLSKEKNKNVQQQKLETTLEGIVEDIDSGEIRVDNQSKEILRGYLANIKKGEEVDLKEVQNIVAKAYQPEVRKYNEAIAKDQEFAKRLKGKQNKSVALGLLQRTNGGEMIDARLDKKMLEGLDKISQQYRSTTQTLMNAALNNSNASYYKSILNLEENRIATNKWGEEGIGSSVSNLLTSGVSTVKSQVSELEKTKQAMIESQSKDSSIQIDKFIKESGISKEESSKFKLFSSKLIERDKQRRLAQGGDEKAKEKAKKLTEELENMEAEFQKRGISKKFQVAKASVERVSAEQNKAIIDIEAKIEETRAQLIPNFLKSIEHLKNIETFTSKTYQAVAEANMKGMSYMSKMGASASEIKSSGNAALESTIKKGESSIKKAQNTYYELNSKERKDKFIREQLEARRKKNGSISDKDRKEVEEMYKTQMATAGEAVIRANLQSKQDNANVIREMEQASNLMSIQRQEGLNLEKALLNTVGAPIQEILKIERESIKETFNQYQNAQERYQKTLEEYKKGNVTQEELLVATNNMKKRQNEAYSQIIGAQRNVMEQMFGRLVGVFKGQAGFAGASTYSKYGAGLSVNAKGEVMALGSENKGANNSYGERIFGNQLSALGVGGVGGEKNDKVVKVIKDMTKLSGETLTTQIDRVLEEMRKEKGKDKDKGKQNEIANNVQKIVSEGVVVRANVAPKPNMTITENKPTVSNVEQATVVQQENSKYALTKEEKEKLDEMEERRKNAKDQGKKTQIATDIYKERAYYKAKRHDKNLTREQFEELINKQANSEEFKIRQQEFLNASNHSERDMIRAANNMWLADSVFANIKNSAKPENSSNAVQPPNQPASLNQNVANNQIDYTSVLKSIEKKLDSLIGVNSKNVNTSHKIEASPTLKKFLEIVQDPKNIVTKNNFRDVQQADVANRNK